MAHEGTSDSSPESSSQPTRGNGGELQRRFLGQLAERAQTLPVSLDQEHPLRGIRSAELLQMIEEALEPERDQYRSRLEELQSGLAQAEAVRAQILTASEETRHYELPRLAALVEVEKGRADEFEGEVAGLERQLQSLREEMARRDQDDLSRSGDLAGDQAEELLMDLDRRLYALEETSGQSSSHSRGVERAGDDERLRLVLEHYAQAEERTQRLAALEDAVWALGEENPPATSSGQARRHELQELKRQERLSSRAVLQVVHESLLRVVDQESRIEQLVQTLRSTQALLSEEVRRSGSLEERLRVLERTVRLGSEESPWPLPEGSTGADLNRVLHGLRTESEIREVATQQQVSRLAHATRAALERLADILDQALGVVGGGEARPRLGPGELERLFEAAEQEPETETIARGWNPRLVPPYQREERLRPEELEPDDDDEYVLDEPGEPAGEDPASESGPIEEPNTEGLLDQVWAGSDVGELDEEATDSTVWQLTPPSESLQGMVARALGQVEPAPGAGAEPLEPAPGSAEPLEPTPGSAEPLEPTPVSAEPLEPIQPAPEPQGRVPVVSAETPQRLTEPLSPAPSKQQGSGLTGGDGLPALPPSGYAQPDPFIRPRSEGMVDETEQGQDWLAGLSEGLDTEDVVIVPGGMEGHDPFSAETRLSGSRLRREPREPSQEQREADEVLDPAEIYQTLQEVEARGDEKTRRLARGLVIALEQEHKLEEDLASARSERDLLESKAREAERALESEVWRGLATHRDLVSARQRLTELEARVGGDIPQTDRDGQVGELVHTPPPATSILPPLDFGEPMDLEPPPAASTPEQDESLLHWLLHEQDPEYRDSKTRAIRACRTALRKLADEPEDAEHQAEAERVEDLLHWLESEVPGNGGGSKQPPLDF